MFRKGGFPKGKAMKFKLLLMAVLAVPITASLAPTSASAGMLHLKRLRCQGVYLSNGRFCHAPGFDVSRPIAAPPNRPYPSWTPPLH